MSNPKQVKSKIVLIEDDIPLGYVIKRKLTELDYEVTVVDNGRIGLERILSNVYSLAIIDVGLPDLSGLKLVNLARSKGAKLPMIVITNYALDVNERESFVMGASLFHPKPIDYDLLGAQIKSLLAGYGVKQMIVVGDMRIEPSARMLSRQGKTITLSNKEFDAVMLLANAGGVVLSRDEILRRTTKGARDIEIGSVDTLVSRMRKKLGKFKDMEVIETVHRSGYRLNPQFIKETTV